MLALLWLVPTARAQNTVSIISIPGSGQSFWPVGQPVLNPQDSVVVDIKPVPSGAGVYFVIQPENGSLTYTITFGVSSSFVKQPAGTLPGFNPVDCEQLQSASTGATSNGTQSGNTQSSTFVFSWYCPAIAGDWLRVTLQKIGGGVQTIDLVGGIAPASMRSIAEGAKAAGVTLSAPAVYPVLQGGTDPNGVVRTLKLNTDGSSAGISNSFSHITTATNTQIKSTVGTLHTVSVNTTAAGAITIVDTSAANCTGGTTIAVLASSVAPQTFTYDVALANGLCITTAAASDLTISWR